jgi:hypothetical protein
VEGKDEVDVNDLIQPEKSIDARHTIWNVLSVVQQKIVYGGFRYEVEGEKKTGLRNQTARELTNIDQKLELRKAFWEKAVRLLANQLKNNSKTTHSVAA